MKTFLCSVYKDNSFKNLEYRIEVRQIIKNEPTNIIFMTFSDGVHCFDLIQHKLAENKLIPRKYLECKYSGDASKQRGFKIHFI